jgi:hypothetical protein
MGYKGKTALDSGFVFAPYPPLGFGDDVNYNFDELMELVFFHIREALPKEVLPARYKMDESYAAGRRRPCIHLTMDGCRTFVIFPLTDRSITFFWVDTSAWSAVGDKRAYQDILMAHDPDFLDDLDGVILRWFREEQRGKSRKDRKKKKREQEEKIGAPITRSWRQIRGQPKR